MINNKTISFPFSVADMKELRAYDGTSRLEYQGFAPPGAATSAAVWQIKKFTYDAATERILTKQFAAGVNDYCHVWNNRASLSYN